VRAARVLGYKLPSDAVRIPTPMNLPQRLAWLCLLSLPIACSSNKAKGEMTDEQKVGLYYERALRYYEMRELDRCQDQVQRGLKIEPKNERLMLMLGRCHQTRGKLEDILIAEKIFREHPAKKDYRVHLCLGGCLERKGSYYMEASEKVASGERFTEAADPNVRADELAAQAKASWKEALTSYQAALDRFPGSFEALNGLMRTNVLLEQFDESFAWSERLLQSIGESNEVFQKRLKELEARGSATVDIEKALLANSDLQVQALLLRSDILHQKGQFREALAELDKAVVLDPSLAEIYARRGQVLSQLGEYQRSNDSVEQFLSLSTDPFESPNIRRAFALIESNKQAMKTAVR